VKTEHREVAKRPPGGRFEALAQRSARVPFRVKVAVVWIVIFAALGLLFAAASFDTQWMRDHWWFIFRGLPYTVLIAALAIILAMILALFGALGRLSRNPISYGLSGFYTSFFRGTPLIVQMFLIYLALPQMAHSGPLWLQHRLTLTALQAGILALGLNYGAYMTEIFRAGIQSVGHGQSEAAEALGMTYGQKMRRIVLPQATRVVIPPTGNEFIAMMKDSALVSFLGATVSQLEVFRRAQLAGRRDFRNLEALILAAGIYWALTVIFQYFQGRLERRLSKGYIRAGDDRRKPKLAAMPAAGTGGAIMVEVPVVPAPDGSGSPPVGDGAT
jgi:polar amino acid transport system permease protein